MKRLTITYDGLVLHDAEVSEFVWVDSASGVKAEGKTRQAVKGGLFEALGSGLASAQKAKTAKVVEEKKADD